MSVICQTFVQNAWRKDLCSNCFKSKEEHGCGGGGGGGDSYGGLKNGRRDEDHGGLAPKGLTRSLDGGSGVGGGSKRYMGVAGSVYQRSYYNRNSWKSMMLDKPDSGLKSPGLIKGMSNLVSHENEKNLKLNDLPGSDNRNDTLRSSRLVQHVKTSQSEAKLLSELLDDGLVDDIRLKHDKRKESDKPYIEDKTDISSDLGSEASNDISSTSSSSSTMFYEVTGSAANSDTTSVKSDTGSEQLETERDDYLGRDSKELIEGRNHINEGKHIKEVTIITILKKAGDPKGTRGSIRFRSTIEEVIGYGGDVDYSDDEDSFDEDDDDDDDFDDFVDLTPDERVLRRLTEKNTDFNSDNDNLKKDIEELLPSVKELEEKRKMIIAEIEELERLGRENRSKSDKAKPQEEKKEDRPEGKVKLKRSPPLVTIKPLIARNNNEVRVNQVLPMKNGEIVRPGVPGEMEEIPLKGIKPKYVSLEDEMVEKSISDYELKTSRGKITSIDDYCVPNKSAKVTSIDDLCAPVTELTTKSIVTTQDEASAITRIDNLLSRPDSQTSQTSSSTTKSNESKCDHQVKSDIRTPPALSVTPSDSIKSNQITDKSKEKNKHIEAKDNIDKEIKVNKPKEEKTQGIAETPSKSNEISKTGPVSAPRKSLLTSSQDVKAENVSKSSPDVKVEKVSKSSPEVKVEKVSKSSPEVKVEKVSKSSPEVKVEKVSKSTPDVKVEKVTKLSPEASKLELSKSEQQKDLTSKKEKEAPKEVIKTSSMKSSESPSKSPSQSNPIKADSVQPSQDSSVSSKSTNSATEQVLLQNSTPPATPGSGIPLKRLSLNHDILEIQTAKDPLKKSSSVGDENTNTYEPEVLRTPEISKVPASRQGSTSSLFTTFGTPVVLTSHTQSSFLHSSPSRATYDDSTSSPSVYHPETTDFLKDIKTHPEAPTPTAGIQKSALYASTSCLKGLPGAKPVITPKPPILKDKPKVAFKPSGSTSRIYATPSPISPKLTQSNLSGAVSTPNLPVGVDDKSDTASVSSSNSRQEANSDTVNQSPYDQKKPPPTTQAPAIPLPIEVQKNEVVYDIPVTIASSQPSTTENLSTRSSPKEVTKEDDATIYHEIDDIIKAKGTSGMSIKTNSRDLDTKVTTEDQSSPSSVTRVESTRCQSRSTFEANRSLLSQALDFGNKALRSSGNKRTAPLPPSENTSETGVEEVSKETADQVESTHETPVNQENINTDIYEDCVGSIQGQESSPINDNNDGESYSSFTDDFDDDEEEEEEEQAKPSLRKAERSSSAIPFYRNSVGPIMTYDLPSSTSTDPNGENAISQGYPPGWDSGNMGVINSKPIASRSHSVPRVAEHMVITDPSPSSTSAFPSKFSFGRSGFFRPSSPPTVKREGGGDRGRDRTKKSSTSRFSLKKLLRLGSKDDEKKSQKEHEKRCLRESKKGRLQIIHPLDYNQNGVEVIARPEKTSPIYDYTGIYGYIPPPRMSAKLEDVYSSVSNLGQAIPPVQQSPAPSLSSKRSEISAEGTSSGAPSSSIAATIPEPSYGTPAYTISSSFSTVSTRTSVSSPIPSVQATSSSVSTNSYPQAPSPPSSLPSASSTTAAGGIYSSSSSVYNVPPSSSHNLEKKSSFLRKESHLDRCESGASTMSNSAANGQTSSSHHLGYNSEGRPKPPPPPRKVSLETSQPNEIYSSVADLTRRPNGDTAMPAETPSRPQRPPPPTRTPSNAGSSRSGPPRPDPPKLVRDSVYANLGDVRAPITPRKPGRSASIRGEDDREKRRAPQPPSVPQQAGQRGFGHKHHDSTSSSCSSISSTTRATKGPAPPRPQQQNDYETYEHDPSTANYCIPGQSRSSSPVLYDAPIAPSARAPPPSTEDIHTPDGYIIPAQLTIPTPRVTQIAVGSTTSTVITSSRIEDVYQVPQNNSQNADPASALSLRQEKTGRLSVRRGSAVTHRSLEDQYGAVISANLEALSNMLDQLSNNCCPHGYEEVCYCVKRWEDIAMDDDIIVGAGHRLFYAGSACGREIILMLTPESKVDAHHLLTPMPITTFRDQIPTHLLSHKTIIRGKTSPGTVWVLPAMSLTTLRTIADENLPKLSKAPMEWERHTSLLLLQYVTGLKQLQAQGVEETCIDLTLAARGSVDGQGQDRDPRVMLVPPVEAGIPVMSLCQCAAAATLMLMGVDAPLDRAKDGNFSIPLSVPSQAAFNCLLQLLQEEKAGSLTKVKCILEVLLFGPDNTDNDGKSPDETEATLQRWLDLERTTVLHTLIRGPLESSVLTKYHLLFLVRTNSKSLRETVKLLEEREVTDL